MTPVGTQKDPYFSRWFLKTSSKASQVMQKSRVNLIPKELPEWFRMGYILAITSQRASQMAQDGVSPVPNYFPNSFPNGSRWGVSWFLMSS